MITSPDTVVAGLIIGLMFVTGGTVVTGGITSFIGVIIGRGIGLTGVITGTFFIGSTIGGFSFTGGNGGVVLHSMAPVLPFVVDQLASISIVFASF